MNYYQLLYIMIKDKKINQYNTNGKEDGYWERYHSNGQLWYKGNYINGNRDGYWEGYYDNGKLRYKGNYINGKKDGYWEVYHDGKLWYKEFTLN